MKLIISGSSAVVIVNSENDEKFLKYKCKCSKIRVESGYKIIFSQHFYFYHICHI